jgi:hypothetical protein
MNAKMVTYRACGEEYDVYRQQQPCPHRRRTGDDLAHARDTDRHQVQR